MSLNRMFERIGEVRETANWRAAFGEPQVIEEQTIIPVARVGYGFGLGFGQGPVSTTEEGEPATSGEGGGGGGGAMSNPLGAIVVTPETVRFEPVTNENKIALAGMLMAGVVIWQVTKTLREIFQR